jgi:hypothetical protein
MRTLLIAAMTAAMAAGAVGAASAQPPPERWGHWDPTWGHDPGPPPHAMWRHWRGHEANWYGHVHTCMTAHTRYDYRRDMYFEHHRWVRCVD